MTSLSTDPLARSRQILWTGLALQVLGIVWDGLWHRRNPGVLETGWALLEAHGVLYAGILVIGAGVLVAFSRAGSRLGPLSWYALVGYGVLSQVVGRGWDAWAHAAGSEVALAHLLSRFGFLLVLAGVALATLSAKATSRGPG